MPIEDRSDAANEVLRDRCQREDLILWEQVKQLYGLAPLGLVATVVNSLIAFFVMSEVLPYEIIGTWLAAVLSITALRLGLVLWFRRAQPEPEAAWRWKRRFLVGLVLIGLAWGSIAFVPFGDDFSLAHQVFFAFVLGGMAAGASSTFSKVRHGDACFTIPALLPLALHFFLTRDPFHDAMGAMTLLFMVLLTRIAQHNFRVNRTSLLLRFENQEMIEGLERARVEVEGLNAQLRAEIEAKLEAEADLRGHQELLERTVEERTEELVRTNVQLKSEIEVRKQIEKAMQEVQQSLLAAKEAAEAGSLAKSEFLANMSHEMRTPLAGVLGMIKLVLDMKIGTEERELLEMARRSADSLLRIIADVLDFSRLEAGMMRFEVRPFSIAEAVRAAVEVVSLSARERGLELSWQVAADLPEQMEGDAGRLRQVLVNLLGNAVKFTERGGIQVAVRRFDSEDQSQSGLIQFSVKDSGVGIAADKLDNIFGKFTQIDSSLTKRYGGTGLGLALSKQIVEKMGGQIWVVSISGIGSTFHFTLPERPAATEPATS